ncbi:MAG: bifunctional glutamate N-acetyltransferase/amino-acid acetyltransferase ArgJ [Gammaproteobacteria bacterium]|nr:bifunctional glutamate N-acetyltransferase/amino-acid acetyltransferase ArgJ [Gammaproteobacteria bacterium]MYK47789.1 bifunctional glutamate N-acetyltransferase/amino-acid acetyltransferase ArgJ [Gammaproteobacteria bacterium]
MAVNLPPMGELLSIDGIRLGSAEAGVKYSDRLDLAVALLDAGSTVGGVFTASAFQAAPVVVARERVGTARALVVNSGNANAATGERGLADARSTCEHLASRVGVKDTEVLPFSTGVIGEFLDMDAMRRGIDAAVGIARPDGWADAARAIMTTDTAPKAVSATGMVGGHPIRATGMVKGSGMIRPDMATMLAFLGTDAAVSVEAVQNLAQDLADGGLNRVTVDGDTSTNDAFVVMATGRAGGTPVMCRGDPRYGELLEALKPLAVDLAQRTARDGEGATKFVTVRVEEGRRSADCLAIAYTIAHSPLVKTAIFAGDPNWGRFCMAIGRAGVPGLDPDTVGLYLDDVCVARGGLVAEEYTEAAGAAVMAKDEFTVRVTLGQGDVSETVWTTDLSYEYIRINAEYRT